MASTVQQLVGMKAVQKYMQVAPASLKASTSRSQVSMLLKPMAELSIDLDDAVLLEEASQSVGWVGKDAEKFSEALNEALARAPVVLPPSQKDKKPRTLRALLNTRYNQCGRLVKSTLGTPLPSSASSSMAWA